MTERKKRPRDFAQRAKMIVDIATGEIEDREPTPEEQDKDLAAVSLGRRVLSLVSCWSSGAWAARQRARAPLSGYAAYAIPALQRDGV